MGCKEQRGRNEVKSGECVAKSVETRRRKRAKTSVHEREREILLVTLLRQQLYEVFVLHTGMRVSVAFESSRSHCLSYSGAVS